MVGYGTLAQSLTIARYLANKYNLAGRTDIAKAQADEIVDTCDELGLSFFKVSFTSVSNGYIFLNYELSSA